MEGGFGGGRKGNGKKACEGLVRACMGNKEVGFEAERWDDVSRIFRRAMGLALGGKAGGLMPVRGRSNPNSTRRKRWKRETGARH